MIDEQKYPYWRTGSRLKALRGFKGMKVKEFTEYCGFNYTRYINWETGHRRMMPDDAEVLCDKLGVTMDFIYRGIEAQLPHNIAMALESNLRVKAKSKSSDTPD